MSAQLKTLVVNCGSQATPKLLEIFGQWSDVREVACDSIGAKAPAADLIVLSGGPRFYQEDDSLRRDYVEQFAFLDQEARPVFGICMGHQGIGLRNGALLFTGQERRLDESIAFTAEATTHPLLLGIDDGTAFAERHTEGITLPRGFVLLGSSRYYPVEIMACRQRPLFGVQFHPELSGGQGLRLLRNFFEIARYHCRMTQWQ